MPITPVGSHVHTPAAPAAPAHHDHASVMKAVQKLVPGASKDPMQAMGAYLTKALNPAGAEAALTIEHVKVGGDRFTELCNHLNAGQKAMTQRIVDKKLAGANTNAVNFSGRIDNDPMHMRQLGAGNGFKEILNTIINDASQLSGGPSSQFASWQARADKVTGSLAEVEPGELDQVSQALLEHLGDPADLEITTRSSHVGDQNHPTWTKVTVMMVTNTKTGEAVVVTGTSALNPMNAALLPDPRPVRSPSGRIGGYGGVEGIPATMRTDGYGGLTDLPGRPKVDLDPRPARVTPSTTNVSFGGGTRPSGGGGGHHH